jgi:hypothetical protein
VKLGVTILRIISPQRERDRVEVREAIQRASAHAEDLSYTTDKLCNGGLRTSRGLRSLTCLPEESK